MTLEAPAAPIFRRLVTGTVRAGIEELGGRPAMVVRTVSTLHRGALSIDDGETMRAAAASALTLRIPMVMVLASSGADVSDGVASLHGWGRAARALAACSGMVPVVVVVTGPALSGPALLLGLADLVIMTTDAFAFVSGPAMVEDFTGIRIGIHQLGGTAMHARSSGLCAIEAASEEDAVAHVDHLLGLLPANADELTPPGPDGLFDVETAGGLPDDGEVLGAIMPERATSSYDVRRVAAALADDHDVTELWTRWSPQLVTALGRIGGRAVGFVANQPQALAGTLDIAASQKGARFVRFCDAFNLPLVTLVDTPGFLPGQGPRMAGDDPPRGRAGLRLRRGHRAPGVRHPAQGVRRGLHRHGLEGAGKRPVLRLARRRDRGDGGRGGGADPQPRGLGPRSRRPCGPSTPSGSSPRGRRPSGGSSTRSSTPRTPGRWWPKRCGRWRRHGRCCPVASTRWGRCSGAVPSRFSAETYGAGSRLTCGPVSASYPRPKRTGSVPFLEEGRRVSVSGYPMANTAESPTTTGTHHTHGLKWR